MGQFVYARGRRTALRPPLRGEAEPDEPFLACLFIFRCDWPRGPGDLTLRLVFAGERSWGEPGAGDGMGLSESVNVIRPWESNDPVDETSLNEDSKDE